CRSKRCNRDCTISTTNGSESHVCANTVGKNPGRSESAPSAVSIATPTTTPGTTSGAALRAISGALSRNRRRASAKPAGTPIAHESATHSAATFTLVDRSREPLRREDVAVPGDRQRADRQHSDVRERHDDEHDQR